MTWKSKLIRVITILIILIPLIIFIYRPQPILSENEPKYDVFMRYFDWESKRFIYLENEELKKEIVDYLRNCQKRFAIFYKSDDSQLDEVFITLDRHIIHLGRWKYIDKHYRIINGDKVLEDIKDMIEEYKNLGDI